jgi:hypothetical protein
MTEGIFLTLTRLVPDSFDGLIFFHLEPDNAVIVTFMADNAFC